MKIFGRQKRTSLSCEYNNRCHTRLMWFVWVSRTCYRFRCSDTLFWWIALFARAQATLRLERLTFPFNLFHIRCHLIVENDKHFFLHRRRNIIEQRTHVEFGFAHVSHRMRVHEWCCWIWEIVWWRLERAYLWNWEEGERSEDQIMRYDGSISFFFVAFVDVVVIIFRIIIEFNVDTHKDVVNSQHITHCSRPVSRHCEQMV